MNYRSFSALLAALSLGACSEPATQQDADANTVASEATPSTASASPEPVENVADQAAPVASTKPNSANVIGLEGLGVLMIGKPVPANGSWKERGAQVSDDCGTISSPDYPGVYAIVSDGAVQRITVGEQSDVQLAEGVKVGSSEADVGKWFAGFEAEPHEYVARPGKYLTAPDAKSGDSALRFEIGNDGKVSLIHVGKMPVLGYVEGCA